MGGFWREVEIYGQKARDVARLLRKGNRVLVIGEERDFMAKDESGKQVQVVKIVAEDIALQLSRVPGRFHIKIIEPDEQRCQDLASLLPAELRRAPWFYEVEQFELKIKKEVESRASIRIPM